MLDWTGSGSPSLAHPSFAERGDAGPPVPAFPDVRAGWPGFCLAPLHMLGWRHDLFQSVDARVLADTLRDHLRQRGQSAGFMLAPEHIVDELHELAHWVLARSLLAQLVRLSLVHMWAGIESLCQGETIVAAPDGTVTTLPTEIVSVPLQADPAGHPVQHTWSYVVDFYTASATVEEVFAVWSSLYWAEQRGQLPGDKRALERDYVGRYAANIPGFRTLYRIFARRADEVGFDVAVAMVMLTLSSPAPSDALAAVTRRVERLWARGARLGPEEVLELPRQAPARSALGRWFEQSSVLVRLLQMLSEPFSDDASIQYWRDLPVIPLVCTFDKDGLYLHATVALVRATDPAGGLLDLPADLPARDVSQPPAWYWNESLRQQLTQGIGVQCPLWDGRACCGKREQLRGFLAHTRLAPESRQDDTWRRWRPLGCLQA